MPISKIIKEAFKNGSALTHLIYINIIAFICVRLISIFVFLFNYKFSIESYLSLPAEISILKYQPWTIITYMFMHNDFFHILFNVLWLYWMGNLFIRYFSHKQLVGLYILGGLSGALFFIASYNIFPAFSNIISSSYLLGASASVLAIMTAVATYNPDHLIRLIFIGNIKISHLTVISVLIYAISIGVSNSGGNIAHIGGAFCGYIFVKLLKNKIDITLWISSLLTLLQSTFKEKSKIHISYKNTSTIHNNDKTNRQNDINIVLDKINKSGYNSLSKEEKELLFKMNK